MPSDYDPTDFWLGDTYDTVTVPAAPESAGDQTPVSVGDFADVLKSVGSTVTTVARSIADLQIARDNIAANQAQLKYNRAAATADRDLAMQQLQGKTMLAKLGYESQLARAKTAITNPTSLMTILTLVGIGVAIFALAKK